MLASPNVHRNPADLYVHAYLPTYIHHIYIHDIHAYLHTYLRKRERERERERGGGGNREGGSRRQRPPPQEDLASPRERKRER